MPLPAPLRRFLAASLLFTLVCFATEAVCRFVLHWGFPYDYPGVHSWITFNDFHGFFPKFAHFHSPEFFPAWATLPYPAPAVAAYKLFLIPQPRPDHGAAAVLRFIGSMLVTSWIMLALLHRGLLRHGLASRPATVLCVLLYACSFAFWFELLQGNIEWVVWAVLTAGVWAFCTRRYNTAAICIGVAGSMKIFPIIYIGLLLAARRFRAAALTVLAAAISTVVALWLVCPNLAVSWRETLRALGSFGNKYMLKLRPVELGFDHSLFALAKLVSVTAFHAYPSLAVYLAIVASAGCALWLFRIRHLPVTNQVLCLAVAAIVLPPVSYDYTLIHLYPGLALLFFFVLQPQGKGDSTAPGLIPALLLLAFLLSWESEFIVRGVRYAGQMKCLALLALGYISLRHPFPAPAFDAALGGATPAATTTSPSPRIALQAS